MELLAPAQLAWLGLTVPLVALYILKRRRKERVVGSTLLWEAALRDMRAERPFKKLVPHLSLLLQLLVIILGALALSRPAGAGSVPRGARIVAIVDTSASMAAREGAATRLEIAKARIAALARALPPGGEIMLVEAGDEPFVLVPSTRDASAIERALRSLAPRGGASAIEASVALAAERLRGAPAGSRAVLLTDAAVTGDIELDGAEVEVIKVGEALDNSGIVAADVRARATDDAPDRCEVFVRVRRFGRSADDVFVTASIEGRGVVASRRVQLDGGETEAVVMTADLPPDEAGRAAVVSIQLSRPSGAEDALALDDVVVAPSPAGRRLPVFLVGCGTSAVQRVAQADPNVELFATTLEALASRDEDAPALDGVVMYCGATPETPPPGDSVVLAPTGARVFEAELGDPSPSPRIVTWNEEDARLRFVTLADIHFAAVRPIHAEGATPLVTSNAGLAIASLTRPNGETTLVALDPQASDWPRSPSFVVFFRNLFERARDRRAAGGVAPGRLGEPLRVPAPDGETVRVTTPGGASSTAISRGGLAVVPVSAEPGVYRVTAAGRELFALRNLLDPEESDLSPRARFTRGGTTEGVRRGDAAPPTEAWPYLAAALLVVLALEALWATRKGAT